MKLKKYYKGGNVADSVEPIGKRYGDFRIGEKCFWSKYKYLVEIKHRENDLCKVRIVKQSVDIREKRMLPIEHIMWVFNNDLKKI